MSKVTIKPSASFDVSFPDGSELTMTQIGDQWEGMVVLADSASNRLILDVGEFGITGIMGEILGPAPSRSATVIKGSPGVLARMQRTNSEGAV